VSGDFAPHIGSGFGNGRFLRSEILQCPADFPRQHSFTPNAAAMVERGTTDRHTHPTSIAITQRRIAKRRIRRPRFFMTRKKIWVGKKVRQKAPYCQMADSYFGRFHLSGFAALLAESLWLFVLSTTSSAPYSSGNQKGKAFPRRLRKSRFLWNRSRQSMMIKHTYD